RVLERPFAGGGDLSRTDRRALRPRRPARTDARRTFRDHRLRAILLDSLRCASLSPRSTPAFVYVGHYVERGFGRWRVDGGMPALLSVLEKRTAERGIDVRTG